MCYGKLFLLATILLGSLTLSAGDWRTKVDPQVLAELEAGAKVEVIVAFKEQADLSLAYRLRGKAAKGQFVYQQVNKVASHSQKGVKALLFMKHQEYRSFAIVNALMTEVDLPLAKAIAEMEPWSCFEGSLVVCCMGAYEAPLDLQQQYCGRCTGRGSWHRR